MNPNARKNAVFLFVQATYRKAAGSTPPQVVMQSVAWHGGTHSTLRCPCQLYLKVLALDQCSIIGGMV